MYLCSAVHSFSASTAVTRLTGNLANPERGVGLFLHLVQNDAGISAKQLLFFASLTHNHHYFCLWTRLQCPPVGAFQHYATQQDFLHLRCAK